MLLRRQIRLAIPPAAISATALVLLVSICAWNYVVLANFRDKAINEAAAELLSLPAIGMLIFGALLLGGWWREQQEIAENLQARAEQERKRAAAEAQSAREREKASEAANRAKSSFLAVMSHEIRTPMNAMLGLSSVLLGSKLDDDTRSKVAAIHDAGEGLLEILNDILDHSKLEAGQLSFEKVAFGPQSIVDSVVNIIGARAAAKGLRIVTPEAAAVPKALVGDAGRLRQVLLNLVANAVKFTGEGGITIAVRCIQAGETEATVEWSVSDTGIGIAPDRIENLFKDFVQADCTINRRFGGSGLGLSICRRIVDQMGGEISLSSRLGAGTIARFSVTLPIGKLEERAAAEEIGAEQLRALSLRAGRPLRMLLADDNATNRLVAAKMLEEFDIQVTAAADGMEAVAAASRFTFDLILMDMRMPEMDGLEATRRIHASGECTNAPIVAFTANAFPEDVKACMDAGMVGFLTKPVRKSQLVGAIVRALSQVALVKPAAAMPSDAPVLDRTELEALAAEIGYPALQESLAVFVEETATHIAKLGAYLLPRDAEAVARAAHALKGTTATFGLRRLSLLAARIEREAKQLDEPAYRRAIAEIEQRFAAARAELAGLPCAA